MESNTKLSPQQQAVVEWALTGTGSAVVMKLSPQQQAVVEWALTGTGSAVVIARAGSGKTHTLLQVALAVLKACLGSIYLGAFNAKISRELAAKCARLGIDATCSTLHSAGKRAWCAAIGNYKVQVNKFKTHDVLDSMMREKKITATEHELLKGAAIKAVEYAKLSAIGILWHGQRAKWDALFSHFELLDGIEFPRDLTDPVGRFIDIVSEALSISDDWGRKVINFDDMLWLPVLHNAPFETFDFVCVDEAQDTNEIRREMAFRMLKPKGRFIAVGDDKQAIYGFTGANSDSLEIISEKLDATILPLTVSFRCGANIIREAQNYVADIEAWSGSPDGVVETVYEDQWNVYDMTERDAVLCRVNAPLVSLAYSCIRNGVPARIEGRDIAAGLIAVTKRWKTVRLAAFEEQLAKWYVRTIEPLLDKETGEPLPRKEDQASAVTDKYETLRSLCAATRNKHGGGARVEQLRTLIDDMFGDSDARDAKPMLTFCSVHKAKGMEWPHVAIYGADKFMPHPMAKSAWAREQEYNLTYVAITRAQQRLTWVNVGGGPSERRER